ELLGTGKVVGDDVVGMIIICLNHEEKASLTKAITKEEVYKAPSLDGFEPTFFKNLLVVHLMCTKKRRCGNLFLKPDHEKAYDRIDWR
ncbi:hypothetical protein A2U01_0036220, partial [Trifolium medium]|nr:hypothetical protein [Trifolium medium]